MVAKVAQAIDADYVVPDKEDSGGPPLPHRSYPMRASTTRMPIQEKERKKDVTEKLIDGP